MHVYVYAWLYFKWYTHTHTHTHSYIVQAGWSSTAVSHELVHAETIQMQTHTPLSIQTHLYHIHIPSTVL